jgi:hypothetical protein
MTIGKYRGIGLPLAILVFIILCVAAVSFAQSQTGDTQPTRVLPLKVKPKINGKDKELARKRFFLIKGSLDENKALVDKIGQQSVSTRDCFYRKAKASEAFINWLKDGDCESVYCRTVEDQFITGPKAVPEFQMAYEKSLKEYKSPELGRLWLTTNLTDDIRDGFYRQHQSALKSLLDAAKAATKSAVVSVMTDRKGTAFFTDLMPGTYLVTNMLPTDLGDKAVLWTCEVKVGLSAKRLQIPPNPKDKNVKCVVIENPLPTCDAAKQSASIK